MLIESGEMAYYQTQNEKAWLGPAKGKGVEKNWV